MEEKYELAKWLAGEMSESEQIVFQKTPEYATYCKIAEYSSQLEVPHFEEEKLYINVIEAKKSNGRIIPLYKNWFTRIAAILVLALGITFAIKNFTLQTQTATNGKKNQFLLPDNSEVVLNSGSQVEYKKWNWDDNRKIELKGEAYFHVAKGKKFEVKTDLGRVTVLGTQFDVKVRNNRFDVTCFEGRVKVNFKDKEIILTRGNSVTFENEIQIDSKIDNTKPEWLDNKIAFRNEHLKNIVEEIERQYNVAIEVNGNQSNDVFTGKIPNDNLDIALEIIATTYHFKITKTSTNKIIFEGK